MSDNPNLTAVGDEPIEARIVAWVLGDAAAFEAAELERLCEERPELLVFRRRMRALHGLLTEAEAAEPDPSWQLPPEKRKVLDEIFGTPEQIAIPIAFVKSRRRFPHWGLSVLAACILALLVAGALFAMRGIGGKAMMKESPAIVSYSAAMDDGGGAVQDLNKAVRQQEETVAQAGKLVENMSRRFDRLQSEESAASMPAAPSRPASATAAKAPPAANQPLALGYPPELIEGTPKPIILPGLDSAPATKPAAPPPADALLAAADEEMNVESEPPAMALEGKKVNNQVQRKPSAPSSSMAKVVAADSTSTVAIPEPPTNTPAPTRDFGDGDDFGAGWGEGGMPAGGDSVARRSRETAGRSGLRSGDGSVNRKSIDAILEDREEPAAMASEKGAKDQPDATSLAVSGKNHRHPQRPSPPKLALARCRSPAKPCWMALPWRTAESPPGTRMVRWEVGNSPRNWVRIGANRPRGRPVRRRKCRP
jgi:hypothetical protein